MYKLENEKIDNEKNQEKIQFSLFSNKDLRLTFNMVNDHRGEHIYIEDRDNSQLFVNKQEVTINHSLIEGMASKAEIHSKIDHVSLHANFNNDENFRRIHTKFQDNTEPIIIKSAGIKANRINLFGVIRKYKGNNEGIFIMQKYTLKMRKEMVKTQNRKIRKSFRKESELHGTKKEQKAIQKLSLLADPIYNPGSYLQCQEEIYKKTGFRYNPDYGIKIIDISDKHSIVIYNNISESTYQSYIGNLKLIHPKIENGIYMIGCRYFYRENMSTTVIGRY